MVKSGYVAGTKEMTLADVSLLTTFVCLKALGSVDTRAYPFVEAWAQRCKQQLPRYEEVCGHAMEALGSLYKQSKATNGRPWKWSFVNQSLYFIKNLFIVRYPVW